MDEAYATWKESPHEKVVCTTCHPTTPEGLFNEIKTTVLEPGLSEIHGRVRIPGKVCQDCHQENNPLFKSANQSLMLYHCLAKNIACQVCHVKSIHSWEVHANCEQCHTKRYAIQAMNFTCSNCHGYLGDYTNATMKKDSCHACHPEKTMVFSIPSKAHIKSWCGECHKPHILAENKPCSSCHHPEQLPGLHAETSHSNCLNCHIPHKEVSLNQVCLSCHKDKENHNKMFSCNLCHKFKQKVSAK